MNMNKKEDLIEQYEDAALALMMSEYAEQEGNRLLQEFEEAKARGDVPAVPAELDEKCRNLIHKAYKKERTRKRLTHLLCFAGKTAAAWFVVIGLCATLIVSVEALRTPVFNFIIEQHDKFTTINLGKDPSEPTTQPTTDHPANPSRETPLDGLLPDGYTVVQFRVRGNGTYVAQYMNSVGNLIILSSTLGDGILNIDTDNANTRAITIAGFNGYLVEEGTELTLFWFDAEHDFSYQLRTTNTSISELWRIAEGYIVNNKGAS